MSPTAMHCFLFEGDSAAAVPAHVEVAGSELVVVTGDGRLLRSVNLKTVAVAEVFARAPAFVTFGTGESLEISDGARFVAALRRAGRRAPLIEHMLSAWPGALTAIALSVAALTSGYLRLLPAAAQWAASSIPRATEQRLGDAGLAELDRLFLRPTELSPYRQQAIQLAFARALDGSSARPVCVQVVFRSAGPEGINAFALPGGTIVLLDALVARLNDEQVLAVLGHELGHVVHKDMLRNFLEGLGVAAAASAVWSDLSQQAANVPAMLGALRYSRDSEREADMFAVRFLHENHLTTRPLYEAFEVLANIPPRYRRPALPTMLSTHPPDAERFERLRQQADLGG